MMDTPMQHSGASSQARRIQSLRMTSSSTLSYLANTNVRIAAAEEQFCTGSVSAVHTLDALSAIGLIVSFIKQNALAVGPKGAW